MSTHNLSADRPAARMRLSRLALLRVPAGFRVLRSTWRRGPHLLDPAGAEPRPDVVGTQLHWEALDTWLTPTDSSSP